MRRLLTLLCFFIIIPAIAQPRLELTPQGFEPVQADIPATSNEKLLEISKAWAASYNRTNKKGYDVYDVQQNAMSISALKKNAFFIRNKGETFSYTIRYDIKLTFYGDYYTLKFTVSDIYTDYDNLVEYKLPDYFTSEGELKDGYENLKPSLEKTVNEMVTSYHNYIINFR
jgi:hypothetical protein